MASLITSMGPTTIAFFLALVTPVYSSCRVIMGDNFSGDNDQNRIEFRPLTFMDSYGKGSIMGRKIQIPILPDITRGIPESRLDNLVLFMDNPCVSVKKPPVIVI